jgi:hypothetical protein
MRVRDTAKRMASSLQNSQQSQELQAKMYYNSGHFLTVSLPYISISRPVVCMYGTVGVVFVSFLLRSCFIYFLMAINVNIAQPNCEFVPNLNRCGEFFQPRFLRHNCEL